eukprot:gene1266-724_t
MALPPEFFVPHNTCDLDDPSKKTPGQYFIDAVCEFDVPSAQQLDDLTRLFDQLHREKSPTAIFSKPELFVSLYSYMKGIAEKDSSETVNKAARHKICHEISERMKKLLQVSTMFLRKQNDVSDQSTEPLKLCLRSTLKMYCYIICTILAASAPKSDEGTDDSSQRHGGRRKRRRDVDSGFGDDASGVDLDGRELALNSLIEMLSDETVSLWPNTVLESASLNLVFRMCLHMITQKANIGGDAQCVSSALSLLLARLLNYIALGSTEDPLDLTFPLIDVAMKSEAAAFFLSNLVSDIEESGSETSQSILSSIFESMASCAVHDAPTDLAGAKNIAIFFSEVSKKSVSVTQKFVKFVQITVQSESHDVRKGAITSLAELLVQKYSGVAVDSDDSDRSAYLNELLFRILDVNIFVRNHTLHIWEKLIDSKGVPRVFYVPVVEAIVGRLSDKSYLVRGSAMSCIALIMKKTWFGQVLNSTVIKSKFKEALEAAQQLFSDVAAFEVAWTKYKTQKVPTLTTEALLEVKEEEDDNAPNAFSSEQAAALSKVYFYECAQQFITLMKTAVNHATRLLDSKTERDVIEAIQLIVTAAECRLDDSDAACLRMIVLVFHNEVKIQWTVRDAFTEIIFSCFNNRSSVSQLTRTTASAQKLIHLLRDGREGEISAVERIFGLMRAHPSLSRSVSDQFVDAIWSIAEGTLDSTASSEDRRTAMRIYSIITKFVYRNLRDRKERILNFLQSEVPKDNMIIAYVFKALENQFKDPHFRPIPATEKPLDHPIVREIITHLCRPTTALASWMCVASAGVSCVHHLCEAPVLVYGYILKFLQKQMNASRDNNTRAQLCFLVGCTALKQLIAVETAERKQMKLLEEGGGTTEHPGQGDSMHKDLGLGSMEFRRHAIQELAQERKGAILAEESLWSDASRIIVSTVLETSGQKSSLERVCALLALCQLMIVSEKFCAEQLELLFSIVSRRTEYWIVKTNIVVAHPTAGLFKLLKDDDLRVRSVTIQVCSHLVLGEMLRIKDHLFTIVKLVADPDSTIAENAVTFIQNLALKEKERTGNLIPPLITKLSGMPQEKFKIAMRTLLERVEGDKPTESLIDRLCQRFESYNERSSKKLTLAENIAFCLTELNYSSDRALKKLVSEPCYQQYKLWLRKPSVLEYFKTIAAKARKNSRTASGSRDVGTLEEWETRIMADAAAT